MPWVLYNAVLMYSVSFAPVIPVPLTLDEYSVVQEYFVILCIICYLLFLQKFKRWGGGGGGSIFVLLDD